MRTIILTDHFGNGGAERVASLIVNGLSKNTKNEVHVCVFEDVNNYNIKKERIFFHVLANKNKGHTYNAYLKIKNLTRVIKTVKPDAIYSFGPIMAGYVYIAKLLSGHKTMKVIDSERNDPRYEPVQDWKKVVRNFCYNRADILVCQTPMAVELLEKTYGVKCKKVIIPNPITPGLPTWKGENSKEIITAVRLTKQKNLPMLIDAFEMLYRDFPEYKLVIYGDGELRSMLTEYIRTKGLQEVVTLPGFASDIHKIMSEAFMYVSSSDYEGISNSMLEALGIGLPCVCTDCPVGGAKMFIKDERTGLLTKVGDYIGLYNTMSRFIIDKNLLINCSVNSREVNAKLSLDIIADQWISLITKQK